VHHAPTLGFRAFGAHPCITDFLAQRGLVHTAKRIKTLSTFLSSRLTEEENFRLKECAVRAGLSKSEWCRQAVLRSLEITPDLRLILDEIMAIRRLLLSLELDRIEGHPMTKDRLSFLVSQADLVKVAMATRRVQELLRASEPEEKKTARDI
jgi:hypothetical protein